MVRILTLACLLWASAAQAATYYVAKTGNDTTGDGSSGTPWLTIGKCASTLVAGDTCIIRDGTYTETVTEDTDGSSGSRIVYQAEHARQVVLVGRFDASGDYVSILNLSVRLGATATYGIRVTGTGNIVTGNAVEKDGTSAGLNNYGITSTVATVNATISQNLITETCEGLGIVGTGHTVSQNTVTLLGANFTDAECDDVDYMRFYGADHVISDNVFTGTVQTPEMVGTTHIDCFQTFDDGGATYAIDTVVVERNQCGDGDQGMMLEAANYHVSSGLIVRNNVFHGVTACAINRDIANVQFFNNTCVTKASGQGFWCRGVNSTASCEFKNNLIYTDGTMYGAYETATLIDGDASSPGKNNLLYDTNGTVTGFAGDVKNQDPLFVKADEQRYQIQPGSPAKDAGIAIAGWTSPTDKDGSPRPQGAAWDIGAYEYGYLPNPPTAPRKPE